MSDPTTPQPNGERPTIPPQSTSPRFGPVPEFPDLPELPPSSRLPAAPPRVMVDLPRPSPTVSVEPHRAMPAPKIVSDAPQPAEHVPASVPAPEQKWVGEAVGMMFQPSRKKTAIALTAGGLILGALGVQFGLRGSSQNGEQQATRTESPSAKLTIATEQDTKDETKNYLISNNDVPDEQTTQGFPRPTEPANTPATTTTNIDIPMPSIPTSPLNNTAKNTGYPAISAPEPSAFNSIPTPPPAPTLVVAPPMRMTQPTNMVDGNIRMASNQVPDPTKPPEMPAMPAVPVPVPAVPVPVPAVPAPEPFTIPTPTPVVVTPEPPKVEIPKPPAPTLPAPEVKPIQPIIPPPQPTSMEPGGGDTPKAPMVIRTVSNDPPAPMMPAPVSPEPTAPASTAPVEQPVTPVTPVVPLPAPLTTDAQPQPQPAAFPPVATPVVTVPKVEQPAPMNITPSQLSPTQTPVVSSPFPDSVPAPATLTLPKQTMPTTPMTTTSNAEVRTNFDVDLHRVSAGETYESISKKQYGDAKYAEVLRRFNKNRPASQGMDVELPPMAEVRKRLGTIGLPSQPLPTSTMPQTTPPPSDGWTAPVGSTAPVPKLFSIPKDGMSFWDVAEVTTGSRANVQRIRELNPTIDANKRFSKGDELRIPANSSTAMPRP